MIPQRAFATSDWADAGSVAIAAETELRTWAEFTVFASVMASLAKAGMGGASTMQATRVSGSLPRSVPFGRCTTVVMTYRMDRGFVSSDTNVWKQDAAFMQD